MTDYERTLYRDSVARLMRRVIESRELVRSVIESIEDRDDLELLLPRLRHYISQDIAPPQGGSES